MIALSSAKNDYKNITFDRNRRMEFPRTMAQWPMEHQDTFKDLGDRKYYLNLCVVTDSMIGILQPLLAQANGVIFDMRGWCGQGKTFTRLLQQFSSKPMT